MRRHMTSHRPSALRNSVRGEAKGFIPPRLNPLECPVNLPNRMMDAGDLDRDFLLFTLAIVGLLWYTILWGIGLLGCMTAYVHNLTPGP